MKLEEQIQAAHTVVKNRTAARDRAEGTSGYPQAERDWVDAVGHHQAKLNELKLDGVSRAMRLLLADLAAQPDGMFIHYEDHRMTSVNDLRKLGIVDTDGEQSDEVGVTLTPARGEWLRQLESGLTSR